MTKLVNEMNITYIFIRYITVTIKRQVRAFYRRYNKVIYQENKEFIENCLNIIEIENEIIENRTDLPSAFYEDLEKKLSYQDLLFKGLNSLNDIEKRIMYEKFSEQRSDADIGKEYSVSSQTISKRKRNTLGKLRNYFST